MSIELAIYLIDVISTLEGGSVSLFFASLFLLPIAVPFIEEGKYRVLFPVMATIIASILLCVAIHVIVPSEKTMKQIFAIHYIKKGIENEKVINVTDKAIDLLELKIDAALEKMKAEKE